MNIEPWLLYQKAYCIEDCCIPSVICIFNSEGENATVCHGGFCDFLFFFYWSNRSMSEHRSRVLNVGNETRSHPPITHTEEGKVEKWSSWQSNYCSSRCIAAGCSMFNIPLISSCEGRSCSVLSWEVSLKLPMFSKPCTLMCMPTCQLNTITIRCQGASLWQEIRNGKGVEEGRLRLWFIQLMFFLNSRLNSIKINGAKMDLQCLEQL